MEYLEKRKSCIEERECINCKKKWLTRIRKSNKGKVKQLLCKECIEILDSKEKYRLYKLHNYFHEEYRECINCGNIWKVLVKNDENPSRVKLFCSECNSKLSPKEKTIIQRDKIKGYHDKEKEQRRSSYRRNHVHNMLKKAYDRAIKYNLEFNLTKEDIIIPEKCPLLNTPFIIGKYKDYEYTPTIDRIDNSKGYTKDNIWIISKKANSMKNSASFEELNTFCTNILRYSLNNNEKEVIELRDKELLR